MVCYCSIRLSSISIIFSFSPLQLVINLNNGISYDSMIRFFSKSLEACTVCFLWYSYPSTSIANTGFLLILLYIRKSKCVAGFIAYRHSSSLKNSGFLINIFKGKWQTTSRLEYLLSERMSSINEYIRFSESYADIFLCFCKYAFLASVYCF